MPDPPVTARHGGCSCGSVRYRLAADPLFVHCRHCLDCQRSTGSAFVVNILIEAEHVEVTGLAPEPVPVPREGGRLHQIFRCPGCRVALWSVYGGRGEVLFVRGGTLDVPGAVAPDVHIFTRSKVPWLSLPTGVPSFAEYYDESSYWPPDSLQRLEAALGG